MQEMSVTTDDFSRDDLLHRRDGLLHRRAFVGLGAATLALVVPHRVGAQSSEQAGLIEDVNGQGFAEAGLARRALAREAPVFIADRVRTAEASRLTLQLGRRTRVRLGELARLTIDRYLVDAGGEITLEAGAMLFDRPSGAPPSPLQVRSSFGLIAVRGTRFFAGPSGGVFGVFVQRGRVVVAGGGQQVELQQGQGTDLRYPGAAPSPPKTWGDGRIKAALASVT
jgi:ferric-dicitrate binding protein FerR (iron transport regulator)